MHLPGALVRRQQTGQDPQDGGSNGPPDEPPITTVGGNGKSTVMPIVIGVVVGIIALLLAIYLTRRIRMKHKNPKYVPTPFLKNLWKRWEPASGYRLPEQTDNLEPITATRQTGVRRSGNPPSSFTPAARDAVETAANNGTTAAGVDRNTSVRSVMTLPAYNPSAGQNEQVLGREGERGGIDVVIEFPETVDEEEQQREAEMEALYQVRLARRRENEEREERRRLRREARERGDFVALREIAERQRATSTTSTGPTVEELRAEHDRIKKERQRAVSSVSYADLGIARHDGTRLRANSHESEREGLLGDAASIAASSRYHRRDRSASSIISIDTMNSDLPSPGFTRTRADSRPGTPSSRRRSGQSQVGTVSTSNEGRAGSSPEMIDHDDIPPNSPPGYENISLDTPHDEQHAPLEPPPDYSSPILGRGEYVSPIDAAIPSPPAEAFNDRRQSASSSRRASHIGQLASDRRSNSSNSVRSTSRSAPERQSSRGVAGAPQLPSLRLGSLPSIQVDHADERDVTEQRHYGHPDDE
ncbi:hypothetical protein L207DRAFT_146639 [Hyaloscypha variabilis F]|uniref:Uncharacterized protein n=1 Tax=Hyaloscypha variabilis (strain UAMH 11265 / GT02V1 / F) TaxID=1149755 RepID=A0A2J6R5L4_HYAVF|nr:hypothetical protein L207DRAFT_146639 [Hyaloscypha variabilis F]